MSGRGMLDDLRRRRARQAKHDSAADPPAKHVQALHALIARLAQRASALPSASLAFLDAIAASPLRPLCVICQLLLSRRCVSCPTQPAPPSHGSDAAARRCSRSPPSSALSSPPSRMWSDPGPPGSQPRASPQGAGGRGSLRLASGTRANKILEWILCLCCAMPSIHFFNI